MEKCIICSKEIPRGRKLTCCTKCGDILKYRRSEELKIKARDAKLIKGIN